MNSRIFIDRFSSADHLPKKATYDEVKAAVLKAGRFSVFEAQQEPSVYMLLERDPGVITERQQYPWIGVKLRDKSATEWK